MKLHLDQNFKNMPKMYLDCENFLFFSNLTIEIIVQMVKYLYFSADAEAIHLSI